MKSDKELYRNFISNDMSAFEELVLRYKNNIIYFISRYTNNFDIAEDISQDVFVYLLVNKNQYNFKYSFKTYLYTIAKCRAINYMKRESRIVNLGDYKNLYTEDKELEEIIFMQDKFKDLKKAINNLNPDYQVVIYLINYEGFAYKDVSKIMDKSLGQVKVLVHRARKKLKNVLEKEGTFYD